MMNGCICCTVRQDLVEVLAKLAKRVKAGTLKLDGIIIETTGMADPAPVAQTFFVDDAVKEFAYLDGIVTLIDAKHIEQHLDDEKEEGASVCISTRETCLLPGLLPGQCVFGSFTCSQTRHVGPCLI